MLFRYILLILLCSPSYIWAQRTINNQDPENENANKLRDNKPEAKDTTHFRLRAYYTDDNNHTVYSALDTMLLGKQRYRERDAYAPSWTTLANYGHAALPNTYFDRKVPQDFLFWTPFQYYWKPVEEEFIYNINKPFTDLYLSKSGKALVNEQRVGLIHSRNFTPRFNVGLRYQVLSTAGSLGHRSKSKHTNFGFVAAYQGLRYKSQFKISKIGITNQLNGGFKPGNFYFDSDSITPQLNTAGEKIGKTDIYLDHEYLIGAADTITHKQLQLPMLNAKASIRHRFKYEHNSRVFYDSQLNYTDSKLDYYPEAIYDTNATYDSIALRTITNILEFEAKENFLPFIKLGLRAGLVHEFNTVNNFQDYLRIDNNKTNYQSIGITAKTFNRVSDYWAWDAGMSYYFLGDKQNNLSLNLNLKRYFFNTTDSTTLSIEGYYKLAEPNYFYRHFHANNYSWDLKLDKESTTYAALKLDMPVWGLKAKLQNQVLGNYHYLGSTGAPEQAPDPILITALNLSKSIKWYSMYFAAEVWWQKNSNPTTLPLPEWIGRFVAQLDRSVFNDAVRLQIGIDASITSSYEAMRYNPSVGMYQISDTPQIIGKFPIVDAFINMRIQSAQVFLKFNNLYQYFNKQWLFNSEYTPEAQSVFRFGVYWHFDD